MKHEVSFRPTAEQDLFDLYSYIAEDAGRTVAAGFIDRIETACLNLGSFPQRGALRDDLAPGVRVVGFERRVNIVFRVVADRVDILRIFYGGRDFEAEIAKDE